MYFKFKNFMNFNTIRLAYTQILLSIFIYLLHIFKDRINTWKMKHTAHENSTITPCLSKAHAP